MAGIGATSQSRRRSTAVLGLLFLLLAGASANTLATVYNYVPQEVDADDHLTLKAGDVVAITHEHGDGWWTGSLRGVVGRFPNNYVEKQRSGDGGGGGVLTLAGGGSDTDHAPGSDDPASPQPHSQCDRVDAGQDSDGADGTPCAAHGTEAGRPPLIDAGVPVPAHASAPRSNTFQTTVLEDFFGADPAVRLVLLAELRASLHLFSERRLPGPFMRNCSEMTAPLLAEVHLIPPASHPFDLALFVCSTTSNPACCSCVRSAFGSAEWSLCAGRPWLTNRAGHPLPAPPQLPTPQLDPPTHQGGPAFAPRAGRAGSAGDA